MEFFFYFEKNLTPTCDCRKVSPRRARTVRPRYFLCSRSRASSFGFDRRIILGSDWLDELNDDDWSEAPPFAGEAHALKNTFLKSCKKNIFSPKFNFWKSSLKWPFQLLFFENSKKSLFCLQKEGNTTRVRSIDYCYVKKRSAHRKGMKKHKEMRHTGPVLSMREFWAEYKGELRVFNRTLKGLMTAL